MILQQPRAWSGRTTCWHRLALAPADAAAVPVAVEAKVAAEAPGALVRAAAEARAAADRLVREDHDTSSPGGADADGRM